MPRREVRDNELRQIIELTKSGASWLKIQRLTGIPRRTAKRVYQEWERDGLRDQLGAARIQVVAEAFRDHVERILEVAEVFVDCLPQWMTCDEARDADEALRDIWRRDIPEQSVAIFPFQQKTEREQRRIFRRNQALFQGLVEHTREEVRWKPLAEWKEAWNGSRDVIEQLQGEAKDMVTSILDNQKPKVREALEMTGSKKAIVQDLAKGVVQVLCRASGEGKCRISDLIRTDAEGIGTARVLFRGRGPTTLVELKDNPLAQEVAKVSRWAAKNLSVKCKKSLLADWAKNSKSMTAAAQKLDEELAPLRLQPILLRTRCELCPA